MKSFNVIKFSRQVTGEQLVNLLRYSTLALGFNFSVKEKRIFITKEFLEPHQSWSRSRKNISYRMIITFDMFKLDVKMKLIGCKCKAVRGATMCSLIDMTNIDNCLKSYNNFVKTLNINIVRFFKKDLDSFVVKNRTVYI